MDDELNKHLRMVVTVQYLVVLRKKLPGVIARCFFNLKMIQGIALRCYKGSQTIASLNTFRQLFSSVQANFKDFPESPGCNFHEIQAIGC